MCTRTENGIDEKAILEAEADLEWIAENYVQGENLATRYEGKFIAVKNKTVLHSSESLDELLQWLREKNLDPTSVVVESIAPRSFGCIL